MLNADLAIAGARQTGWSGPEARRDARAGRPALSLGVTLMIMIVVATLVGGGWVFLQSSEIIQQFDRLKGQSTSGRSQVEADFLALVNRWELAMTLVVTGGGTILMALYGYNVRRRRMALEKELARRDEERQVQIEALRIQLSGRHRLEEDARQHLEMLTKLSQENARLTEELNHRRHAERNLTQQQQELARSKDVLTLHVQARTQEVEKLQRRSELILNSAGEGICGFDLSGRITFANPAAARIMGKSVEELVGRSDLELFAGFRAPPEAFAASKNLHPVEIVASRCDGTSFAAEFVRSPLNENGRTVGEVLVFKDITERKQAAETLALKAKELARSNAELEQFAFVASHDLQEPLRKIQAFGDRLKMRCDEANLTDGRDYLDRMQNAAARMRRLIDDLLTFSRVISRTEAFVPVKLNEVTREVLGDLETSIERSHAKIEVGELPTVEADAVQMRQLLQNLIGNALKFQPPGGQPVVRIEGRVVSASAARGHTAFFSRKDGDPGEVAGGDDFCELTVKDNGIGFGEQYLEKIFAIFQRLHGRQEYEGTGIGLAVCRRIADRHGGSITAHSQPGQGATFVVNLPLRQPAKTKNIE